MLGGREEWQSRQAGGERASARRASVLAESTLSTKSLGWPLVNLVNVLLVQLRGTLASAKAL